MERGKSAKVNSGLSDAVDYIPGQIPVFSWTRKKLLVDRRPVAGLYLKGRALVFTVVLSSHYKLSVVGSICRRGFNDNVQVDDFKALPRDLLT